MKTVTDIHSEFVSEKEKKSMVNRTVTSFLI